MSLDMYIVLSSIALISGAFLEWRRQDLRASLDAIGHRIDALECRLSQVESLDSRVVAVEASIDRLRKNL